MKLTGRGKYFDPEGLARLGGMELVARQVVEGFLTGRHKSPYHGFSVEFLDHRPYVPGDEIRMVDWKLLARTEKYYVKLFQDETNLRATILLDCSKSMAFKHEGITKLEYGAFMAAALTYLMLKQNDAVGLAVFDTTVRRYLPARAHPTQFRRVMDMLGDAAKPGGDTDLGKVLNEVAERVKRRGLIVIISDLLDNEKAIASGLQRFRHDRHEVIVLHVLDDAEISFPFDRSTHFKDMEGAGRIAVNPNQVRQRYLQRLQAFLDQVKHLCFERKVSYALANTRTPYDAFLAAYLDKRSRMG